MLQLGQTSQHVTLSADVWPSGCDSMRQGQHPSQQGFPCSPQQFRQRRGQSRMGFERNTDVCLMGNSGDCRGKGMKRSGKGSWFGRGAVTVE